MVQFDTDFEYDTWFNKRCGERIVEGYFGYEVKEVIKDGESRSII